MINIQLRHFERIVEIKEIIRLTDAWEKDLMFAPNFLDKLRKICHEKVFVYSKYLQ
jgi:hypothetical protein